MSLDQEQRPIVEAAEKARQGVTGHNVRYVLAISVALAAGIMLGVLVYMH